MNYLRITENGVPLILLCPDSFIYETTSIEDLASALWRHIQERRNFATSTLGWRYEYINSGGDTIAMTEEHILEGEWGEKAAHAIAHCVFLKKNDPFADIRDNK